jgi:PhnB protein
MKKAIQPYLHFEDNCKEAMQFYQTLFGGELYLMVVGESPAKEEFAEEYHHQILHSTLRNEDFVIMASDTCGMGPRNQGNTVQLSLDCSSEEEINGLYQALSKEGQIVSDLKEEFWGDLFAMVIDKFGVQWMMFFEIKKDR